MKNFKFLIYVLLAMFLFSCGPSVEGETKDWAKNQTATESLKQEFPAYASMIESKWKEAKALHLAAEGITDVEQKAKKMLAANTLLDRGCIGSLRGFKGQISSIETKMKRAKTKRKTAKKGKSAAADAIDDTKEAIKYAGKVMAFSENELGADPCAKITRAHKLLSDASRDLASAMRKMNAKGKTKKGSKVDGKAAVKKETKATKISCKYCGAKNEAAKHKCSSCGASI